MSDFKISVSGSTVTYTATVCNQGSSTSTSFDLELFFNDTSAPGCSSFADWQSTINGLSLGQCVTRTYTRYSVANGTYTAWARADADCSVAETNENNNNTSKQYTVGGVDLVISSFDVSVAGSTVTYTATVCNIGDTTTASFDLEIYYHETSAPGCTTIYDRQTAISGLASGECDTRQYVRTNALPGAYTAWARADADCQVTEANENNNNSSQPYTVGSQPDLVVSDFDISVSGTTVTYTIQVCNQGVSTTSDFDVEVYFDQTAAPDCNTFMSRQTRIYGGLSSGSCTTVTFTQTGAANGTYTGWARVDADCEVTETNENNNNASQIYSIGGPDLLVTNLDVSVSGTTVTYTITACNNGTSTSSSFYLDLYTNRTTAPSCTTSPDQYWTITGLGSGACETRTYTQTGASAGSYTAWVRADGDCSINETDENNNDASQQYTVGGPDLVISSFTTTVSGTSVTFSATVCNNGSTTTAAFFLDLYLNQSTAPTCTGSPDQYWTISGLAAGQCVTHTHTENGMADGSYTAWARADGACNVTETDEANNNASSSYTVGQPDLVISSFSTTVSGTSVTHAITVCNNGGATTSSFFLDLYFNQSTAPTCPGSPDQYWTISGLGAGMCETQTYTQTSVANGSYTAWARADGDCMVTESNENNNNASSAYSVGTAPLPDLVVSSFTTSVAGDTVTFNVQVCNNGGATSSSFDLEIYYTLTGTPSCSSIASQEITISGLAGSACTTRTFTRTSTPAGSYTSWARVDADCVVTESNEGNNNASSAYTVSGQPDLVVSSFTASVTGSTVVYNITACNNGASTTASFYLDLYFHETAAPSCSGTPDQWWTISGLASGACTSQTYTRTNVTTGSYTAWARVDGACSITESDENNNNLADSYTVTTAQPDLVLTSFTASVAGNVVTFSATICNNGNGDANMSFDLEVYYHLTSAPDCNSTYSQQAVINGLTAGACSTHTFTRTGTPNGSYTGWGRVDADCVVTEPNESNNNQSAQYTVLFVPVDAGVDAGPDGTVEDSGADSTVKEDTGGQDQQVQSDQQVQTDQQVQLDQQVQTDQLVPQQDRGLPPDQGPQQLDFGGVTPDGTTGGDDVTPPGDEGCACNLEGASLAGLALPVLLLLGLLLLRRRRS